MGFEMYGCIHVFMHKVKYRHCRNEPSAIRSVFDSVKIRFLVQNNVYMLATFTFINPRRSTTL